MTSHGKEIRLPLSDTKLTLTDKFDKRRVSDFLDQVLDDDFDVKSAQEKPQAVLDELGIHVSEKDRSRLGELTLNEMLGRPGDQISAAPAAAVAVAVVVLCWPTPAE
jgi:hypothetical protein